MQIGHYDITDPFSVIQPDPIRHHKQNADRPDEHSWYTMNFVMKYRYTCSVERSEVMFYHSVLSERPTDTAEAARPRRSRRFADCTGCLACWAKNHLHIAL